MERPAIENAWETMSEIIESRDAARLRSLLESLTPSEIARSISRLSPANQKQLLALLGPSDAAAIITDVSDEQAVDLIERLPAGDAAAILNEVRSDHQADLLGQMEADEAEAIIERMSPEEAHDVRRLLEYPEDTAGGVMITEYLAYPGQWKILELLRDLEQNRESYADYSVQYLFVVGEHGKLDGVLRMRDLVFSPESASLVDVMIKKPLVVRVDTKLDELRDFFERHTLLGLPVVDEKDRLVGVVRRAAVEEAVARRANRQFLGASGIVGGEEFRTMPMMVRSGRRLSWLSINIVLNIIAASVIAIYQDTLAAAIALAVFLPMISDMSGCSGNQAVAVSLRELTLGLVRPNELLRVLSKEASVGVLNGIVLGLLLGGVALLWKGNPFLGLVVGFALAANTVVAVSIGGLLPLVLKRFKLDPALVSGPVLTTITDMCGFFLVLSFATVLLSRLSGI